MAVSLPKTTFNAADPVVLVDSSGRVVGGSGAGAASATITRPANTTAYTANDVIGAGTQSAAVELTNLAGASGGDVIITTASLELDITAIPTGMTSFTLELYSATPPSAYGDNAAWDLPSGDRSVWLGNFNIGTPVDLGSTCYVVTSQINQQVTLTGSSMFAYLVTNGGYTPAANSEVYKINLHVVGV